MKLLRAVAITILLSGAAAQAGTVTLKKVQVTDGSQIDLVFDGKITPKQLKTEYFNDIIQVSLSDVSVYPAKISSVSGEGLTKVFAYQYAPKLVRCRLTVKGNAEDYKNRFELKQNGKTVSLRIASHAPSKKAETAALDSSSKEIQAANSGSNMSAEEKQLLDHVIAASSGKPEAQGVKVQKAQESGNAQAQSGATKESSKESAKAETSPLLGGKKSTASPAKGMIVLFLMLSVMGAVAYGIKRFGRPNLKNHKGLQGLLGIKGLRAKPKMIEVMANHYLGPKKSISVVKISGKLMVLGVTNESINLIAQLPDGASQDAIAEAAMAQFDLETEAQLSVERPNPVGDSYRSGGTTGARFSDALTQSQSKPQASPQARTKTRDLIRSKLEGMKPLA